MQLTASFTDAQGTTFSDAVVMFNHIHKSVSQTATEVLDESTYEGYTVNSTGVTYYRYQVYYWIDAAAKTAGHPPYMLRSPANGTYELYFEVQAGDASYDGLTPLQAVQKHFLSVVLPALSGSMVA